MARRPAFFVHIDSNKESPPVDVVMVDFQWFPGMSKTQKQKSIDSLHASIKNQRPCRVLEVSSKSSEELGVKLSAFNLGFVHPKSKKFISVESAFQGSKVYLSSGPFPDLYALPAREAKSFAKEKDLGPLVYFDFFGQQWPIQPMTMFYDWLYLNSLNRNQIMAKQILEYDCFTDIEFNPKKSINCQAYSAALFVSLHRKGLLDEALVNQESYIHLMKNYHNWIEATEFSKCHSDKQSSFFDD